MNALMSVLALGLVGSLSAQSPLTTLYGANGGGPAGGQVLFDLAVNTTVTITRLDLNSSAAVGQVGAFEVYTAPVTWVGNERNPGAWTLAGSGFAVAGGYDQPSPGCITGGVVLAPGTYGVAVRYVGLPFLRTNGNGSNQVYSNAEMTLTAGGSQNTAWGTTFTPRVFNGAIHYLIGTVPGPFQCGSVATYGAGCGGLGLTAFPLPVIGGAVTMRSSGIPAGALANAQLLSFTKHDPGIDLGPRGAPNCLQHVGVDTTMLFFGTGAQSVSVQIPGSAALTGLRVLGQAVSLVPGINALSAITSNGVELQLGNA